MLRKPPLRDWIKYDFASIYYYGIYFQFYISLTHGMRLKIPSYLLKLETCVHLFQFHILPDES